MDEMSQEWKVQNKVQPDEALLRSVDMILSRKPTPNTYKFAIVRAVADQMAHLRFGPDDPIVKGIRPEVISFQQLARSVLGYYWPIALLYRLRQSIDAVEEPTVMQLLRDEAAELGLSPYSHFYEYVRSYPDRYEALVSRCCDPNGTFVKAISRLHMVTYYRVDPKLYEINGTALRLSASCVEFLLRYQVAVAGLSIRHWTQFTERLTTSPKVQNKIEGGPPFTDENVRRKYSCILIDLWKEACFYCNRSAASVPLTMGYVVPLAYVYEDRIWNVVLNCDVCSTEKGERTPPDSSVERLAARNLDLLRLLDHSKFGLGNRDLHELRYYGPRITEHLRGLIACCRADGFGSWPGPQPSV